MRGRKMLMRNCMVFLAALLSIGCVSMEGKFTASKSANVSAFADHTISMLSGADFGMTKDKAIYVREYAEFNGEEELQYEALLEEAESLFKGIIKYSIALVTITEANPNVADRIEAYAKYLEKIQANAEKKLDLEEGFYDNVLESVRQQEKFLGALQQAQPIMNAVGRYGETLMTDIDEAAKVLARKLDGKIDERYAEVIAYQEALETEKYSVLRALGKLYLTYKGDPDAFDEFRKSDAIINKKIIPKGKPTEEQLQKLADHLAKRLEGLQKIWNQIEPDWDVYRASHRELDGLYDEVVADTRKARLFVLLWLRAHQKMASGISSPAAWFDIESAPAQLFQLGAKAVF